jgi:hypothetical protein
MTHTHTTAWLHGARSDARHRIAGNAKTLLHLTFHYGPRQLLTSRISAKCAVTMMTMCAPSLLCCSLLTIPALLFQSPQQQAYFHFSRVLNEDPMRWIVLVLAGVCSILSLAMPATMPAPRGVFDD